MFPSSHGNVPRLNRPLYVIPGDALRSTFPASDNGHYVNQTSVFLLTYRVAQRAALTLLRPLEPRPGRHQRRREGPQRHEGWDPAPPASATRTLSPVRRHAPHVACIGAPERGWHTRILGRVARTKSA